MTKILITFLSLFFVSSATSSYTVEVIKNSAVTEKEILRKELYNIFTMRKKVWEDETPISVVVLPPTHRASIVFSSSVIKFGDAYNLFRIIDMKDDSTLIKVASEAEVLQQVASNTGGIGYVNGKVLIHASRVSELSITDK